MKSHNKTFSSKEFDYLTGKICDFERIIQTINFNIGVEKKWRKYVQRSFDNIVSLSSDESGGDLFSFVKAEYSLSLSLPQIQT